MRYQSKPIIIDAIQFTGTNTREVALFCNGFEVLSPSPMPKGSTLFVAKSQSAATGNQAWNYLRDVSWSSDIIAAVYDVLHDTWVGVKRGQFIIRGTKGEFYPCDPEVFEMKYEPMPEGTDV